jgi:hypothetical protein
MSQDKKLRRTQRKVAQKKAQRCRTKVENPAGSKLIKMAKLGRLGLPH